MRTIVRVFLAALAAVSAGFIWTVGQAGLAQTNRNLCDLWGSLPLPTYRACAFQNSLVYAALGAAALLLLWGIIELVLWIFRLRKRSKNSVSPKIVTDATPGSFIELKYGEDGPFERVTTGSQIYRLERMLLLEFSNTDPRNALTQCKVEITDIQPFAGVRRPVVLRDNFTVPGGDHVFIPLVTYGESRTISSGVMGDTAIGVCAPEGANPHFLIALPHDVENVLTIRATAIGSAFCEAKVVIWAGAGTRLRIRKYDPNNDELADIPLEVAAQEAYGAARNTEIGLAAEKMNTNGVLAWFAYYYHTKGIPVFGNIRNSTRIEPVLFRNVDIKQEDGKLIGKEIYSDLGRR